MQIHVIQNGAEAAPYSQAQFDEMLRKGLLGGDDLSWHEGCGGWLPVSQHPDFPQTLLVVVPPPPPPRPATARRAVQPAGALNICPSCGHAVAKSATSCPNCGGRLRLGCLPKLAMGIGALVGLYLVLAVIGTVLQRGTPQAQRERTRVPSAEVAAQQQQRPQVATASLPEAETAFIDTVESYISRYSAAGNQLQKSAVRTERHAALARTISDRRVSAWVGMLKKLETTTDGKASISVQLEGSAISVETGIGNPFDVASSTLIEHGSMLYNKLASLSVGDRVVFSGSFLPGEQDHLKETSFTESGAMTEPSFVMRFSGVESLSAVSTAMPVVSPTLVARAQASPSVTPLPVATATPSPVLPPDEAAFIDAIQSYVSRYSASSNELQKSAARADRARRLARLMTTMQVVRWVGTLREMRTISDGTATIAIRLPESTITVSTVWSNPFDPASKTLIDPSLSLYKRLSSMSTGSEVTFSGNFLSGEPDYLKETSFTEAGSMTEPDFAMRFADVTAPALLDPATSGGSPSLSTAQSDSQNGVSSLPIERTGPPDSPPSSTAVASTPLPVSATPPTVATSTSQGSLAGASGNTTVSERLLIGKWQGARHLTEYRADHTRVMDGVSLNPPRTWHLDGDRLTESPWKNVYKVVFLDQTQLMLEGDRGDLYGHQRVQAPIVNEAGSNPVDPVSVARRTVLNFYNWYLERDGQGLSPWKDGSLAQRNDVTHLFAVRSQTANEPEGEADLVLAGLHLPNPGSVLDAKVSGLMATVLVRLVARDIPHEVSVKLVRSTENSPWKIDDVRAATRSASAPTSASSTVDWKIPSTSPSGNNAVRTPTSAGPPIRLKLFENAGHTCRLLLPEDGWVPVENPPRGTRLALEGPGGIRLSARSLDGMVGDRSLAVMFARAVKERFPFDDVSITPTKPEDHQTVGKRTCRVFSAESRDHFERSFAAMPDGPMKQAILAGTSPASSKKSNLIWWSVISEGSATWVVETEATYLVESPAEIKNKMERSPVPEIREFPQKVAPPHNDYVGYFKFWKEFAFETLVLCIRDQALDADGLTPVIDSNKQAADAKVARSWNIFMDVAAW